MGIFAENIESDDSRDGAEARDLLGQKAHGARQQREGASERSFVQEARKREVSTNIEYIGGKRQLLAHERS